MGKVVYDLFFRGVLTWFVVVWFVIAAIMFHRRFLGKRFEWREERILGPKRRRQVIDFQPENDYRLTSIVTCAKEEPDVFALAMSQLRAQNGLSDHKIIVVMDAIDDLNNLSPDDSRCLEIAYTYADFVLVTNVRDKRENIRNGVRFAVEKGILHPLLGVLDSDTVCDHQWVAAYLAYEFSDQRVGAATTAQRCLRTNTGPERIGDWLENARLKSSMAAGSLYGQVGCVPGRFGMYRSELIEPRLDELADEVWTGRRFTFRPPFVEEWKVKCKAGDDRQLTNFVLEHDYRSVLVLPAGVKTLVPDNYRKLWKTWRRWGTSSQGYVYRTLFGPKTWLWRKWFVLYHYVSDIAITHASVAMVLAWFYSLVWSDDELLLPLTTVMLMSIAGVMATFTIRQWAHLREHPRDWVLLPLFVLVVTGAQFVRLWAHYTPWRIGTWSTRGVDDIAQHTYVKEYRPGA